MWPEGTFSDSPNVWWTQKGKQFSKYQRAFANRQYVKGEVWVLWWPGTVTVKKSFLSSLTLVSPRNISLFTPFCLTPPIDHAFLLLKTFPIKSLLRRVLGGATLSPSPLGHPGCRHLPGIFGAGSLHKCVFPAAFLSYTEITMPFAFLTYWTTLQFFPCGSHSGISLVLNKACIFFLKWMYHDLYSFLWMAVWVASDIILAFDTMIFRKCAYIYL